MVVASCKANKEQKPSNVLQISSEEGPAAGSLGQELPLGNRMKTRPGLMFKTQKTQMQTENPVIILLTLAIFHPNI